MRSHVSYSDIMLPIKWTFLYDIPIKVRFNSNAKLLFRVYKDTWSLHIRRGEERKTDTLLAPLSENPCARLINFSIKYKKTLTIWIVDWTIKLKIQSVNSQFNDFLSNVCFEFFVLFSFTELPFHFRAQLKNSQVEIIFNYIYNRRRKETHVSVSSLCIKKQLIYGGGAMH